MIVLTFWGGGDFYVLDGEKSDLYSYGVCLQTQKKQSA